MIKSSINHSYILKNEKYIIDWNLEIYFTIRASKYFYIKA